MRSHPRIRIALAAAAGLCLGATVLARDDRPLPHAEDIAVGLDDSLARVQQSFPRARIVDAHVDRHGGRWVYLIKTFRGSTLRTVKIDVASGQTVVNRAAQARGTQLSELRREDRRLSGFTVSRLDATAAAQAAYPGARVVEVEPDDLNDRPVWKVSLLDGTRLVTVYINAATGRIIDRMNDGVVNLSLDEVRAKAQQLFPGWTVVRIELDNDDGFDDRGAGYNVRLVNAAGTQRRDVRIDAETGAVTRDRVRAVASSNVAGFRQIVGAQAALTPAQAGQIAADSIPGSRVREVELRVEEGVPVYEVQLVRADGTRTEVKVNAQTGALFVPGTNPGGGDPGGGAPAIAPADAGVIAAASIPGSRVREIELETEHGALVYEVQLLRADNSRVKVYVDAATGAILRTEDASSGGGNPGGDDGGQDGGDDHGGHGGQGGDDGPGHR